MNSMPGRGSGTWSEAAATAVTSVGRRAPEARGARGCPARGQKVARGIGCPRTFVPQCDRREGRSSAGPGRRHGRRGRGGAAALVSSRRRERGRGGRCGSARALGTHAHSHRDNYWSKVRAGGGRGNTRGTARGKRRPARAFPSPSRAALLPPPPAAAASSLPLLPSSRQGGGGRGLGGQQLCRALVACVRSLSKTASGARGGGRGSARARDPPLPLQGPNTLRTLNDSAAGRCAARAELRHCRFKLACPLFGIGPMGERPLPAASQ